MSTHIVERLAELGGASLHPAHRALLFTNGTLTDALEAIFLEPIDLVKCPQTLEVVAHPALEVTPDETIIDRRIRLRGAASGRIFVYAVTSLAADRLGEAFRTALCDTDVPLGRLFQEFRLETRKELLEIRRTRPDDETGFEPDALTGFTRTYRVIAGGRPLMVITEHFAPTLFQPV